MVELVHHSYRYYPYELELARREVSTLMPRAKLSETNRGIHLTDGFDEKLSERLVYFAGAIQGDKYSPTLQSKLELVNGNGVNRQSTRYSAHGIHEYKGKFNPQIVKAILNILKIEIGKRVFDPFCGSGTSLLECDHLGMRAVGTDINPLAVFIANAKLTAVRLPADNFRRELAAVLKRYKSKRPPKSRHNTTRRKYLLSWFDLDILDNIERLRDAIERCDSAYIQPLLVIASNLLRDYSQQDPKDLRIRRRKSPLPEKPFIESFEQAALDFFAKLESAQTIIQTSADGSKAHLIDSQGLKPGQFGTGLFDCALTSPPYATALPYIDTQRLSLVWLGLVSPSDILPLEARLVGSREVRGESKKELLVRLANNSAKLPVEQASYCLELQSAIGHGDGFRRQAVPLLLYRYFAGMAQVFRSVRPLMKKGAPFALIVGSNHTILSGNRFNIDTPHHLAVLASDCGWQHVETVPLQTYRRYGYHVDNAVKSEGMVIVRAA